MEYKLFEQFVKTTLEEKLKPLKDEISVLISKHHTVYDNHRHVERRFITVDIYELSNKMKVLQKKLDGIIKESDKRSKTLDDIVTNGLEVMLRLFDNVLKETSETGNSEVVCKKCESKYVVLENVKMPNWIGFRCNKCGYRWMYSIKPEQEIERLNNIIVHLMSLDGLRISETLKKEREIRVVKEKNEFLIFDNSQLKLFVDKLKSELEDSVNLESDRTKKINQLKKNLPLLKSCLNVLRKSGVKGYEIVRAIEIVEEMK